MKFTVVIGLAQDTAEAAFVLVVAGGGVNDEGIGSIFARIIYNRFGAKSTTEQQEEEFHLAKLYLCELTD